MSCLPGSSAGWALPAKMNCTGRSLSLHIAASRSRSDMTRSARLYVAKRRPKPIVSTFGSSTLRAASTASSLSPRRRHCRLTRRRTNASSRFFSALCVSHSSPGSTLWMFCQTSGSPMRNIQLRRKMPVVKLLHLLGEPTRNVHAVGDVADGNFFFDAPRPEVRPTSAAKRGRASWLTALARRESFRPTTVIENGSCSFCGSTRPRPMSCS